MANTAPLSASDIRQAQITDANLRERDLAAKLNISEAQLLAANTGDGVTRIAADLERVAAQLERFGEVMALTRNESCVIEKTGEYANFRAGAHAGMVLNGEMDLRMFPRHWVHGFAVEKPLKDGGIRRSIQIFDAAGDAVHKVFLRDESRLANWETAVETLRLEDQSDTLEVEPRSPVEPAKGSPEQAEALRAAWDEMTDTHQFVQMVRKQKVNRLGAYRIAGAPYVRPLQTSVVTTLLEQAAETGLPIMVFVGNMGCIEIHTGPIKTVKPMGPWMNVLDPRFNLHLRADHIAEVWQVTKSTKRGDAVSVEAFDKHGMLILQMFGVLAEPAAAEEWNRMVFALDGLKQEELA